MSTLNITLSDDIRALLDKQASARGFASAGEYLSDMVSKQLEVENLREKLQDGADSGPGQCIDDNWFAALHKRAAR